MLADVLINIETRLKANLPAEITALATLTSRTIPAIAAADIAIADDLFYPKTAGPWVFVVCDNDQIIEELDQRPSGTTGYRHLEYDIFIAAAQRGDKTRKDLLIQTLDHLTAIRSVIDKGNGTGQLWYWLTPKRMTPPGVIEETQNRFVHSRGYLFSCREKVAIGSTYL